MSEDDAASHPKTRDVRKYRKSTGEYPELNESQLGEGDFAHYRAARLAKAEDYPLDKDKKERTSEE